MRIFIMIDSTFLFDTYALIEIFNKNPKYERYIDARVIINEFIFAEYCYKLFLENIRNIDEYLEEVICGIIKPNNEIIKEAMKFRSINKKKKMSMTDCISYIQAKKLAIKFLTGDKEFENLENAEFVKK